MTERTLPSNSVALLDGDIFVYRIAAVTNEATLEVACGELDRYIELTLAKLGLTKYHVYLTGKNNFRKTIYSEYKANRRDMVEPRWRRELEAHLLSAHNAIQKDIYEADDLLGIEQSQSPHPTIIVSIDKDLRTIPGWHFNFVKDTLDYVEPIKALQFFYKQLLIGDTADNIVGVAKIGPVKAGKLLDTVEDESEMLNIVYNQYDNPERLLLNIHLMYIHQQENDNWCNRKVAEFLVGQEKDQLGLHRLVLPTEANLKVT